MANSNKIESRAITKIRDIVDSISNAEHDINEKDKKIVLDGKIYFFKNDETNKKENFSFGVDVQIKGRENFTRNRKSKSSYPLDVADLEFMLKNDGALLLVVDDWRGKQTVQYASLLPYELREYIKDAIAKHNKTKSIRLNEITSRRESEELKRICEVFNANRRLQKAAPELAFNNSTLDQGKEYIFLAEHSNPIIELRSRLQEEKCYYNLDDNKNVTQIVKCKLDNITAEGLGAKVFDIEKTESRTVRFHASQEDESILIGDSFKINLSKNTFEYCIHGGLKKQIEDTRFLQKLIGPDRFMLGDKEVEIHFDEQRKNEIKKRIGLLDSLNEALIKMHVLKDPNLDLWDPEKTVEVAGILKDISNNREVRVPIQKPTFGTFNFYDIKLALFFIPTKNGKGNFVTIDNILNGEVVITATNAEGYSTNNPLFALKSNVYLANNFDLKMIDGLIENSVYSKEDHGLINQQALELIKAFDENKNETFLGISEKLLKLCAELDTKDSQIITINKLQIKKRKGKLSIDDISEITEIKNSAADPYLRICCEILLNHKRKAIQELGSLESNEAKKIFKSQPIMNLLKVTN
ncbi:MAG: DUF4365 domain-containing protein [Candidatus Saccharibacteria bacterium]|nr:DUF4365 domain-containing protein [Candidatus Saccharibacteria bacterium]